MSQRVADFINRCESDSGFLCRQVLGMNYDEAETEDGKVALNVGTGGIRANGPHKLMSDFLDSPASRMMMQAPRGSYKSSLAQGRVIRAILKNPNARIAMGMNKKESAIEKARAIRSQLENNERIIEFWGPQVSDRWGSDRFTVAGRTDMHLQEPTVTCFSLEAPITGGHYDLVVLDDIVDHLNVRTKEGIEKTRVVWQQCSPLLVQGGQMIVMGTRYSHMDLYGEIERNHKNYKTLILDSGVEIAKSENGSLSLRGEPLFPHMTIHRLKEELGVGYDYFMAQYMNRVSLGANQAFTRDMFRSISIRELDLSKLTGFILTDTAWSERESGCYNVIAYVALDVDDNMYVLDMRVGHWRPTEFEENFFAMLSTWSRRINHSCEMFEKIAFNNALCSGIEREAVKRNVRLNLRWSSRKSTDQSKAQRILRLQSRLQNGKFFVVDTVPRTFVDIEQSGLQLLYEPEFETDEVGLPLPGGELVDEFVNFPQWPKKDIPDALADIDEVADGHRVCHWQAPRRRKVVDMGARRRQSPGQDMDTTGGSWWEDTYTQLFEGGR